MKFEFGDATNLEYGTDVKVRIMDSYVLGKIVGKASLDITNSHIIKCTDGTYPNDTYKYDCFALPLTFIETIDK